MLRDQVMLSAVPRYDWRRSALDALALSVIGGVDDANHLSLQSSHKVAILPASRM
jgi:hypothetical protein